MADLTFAGSLYLDRVPDRLREWLSEQLEETIWGAIETGSSRAEGDVWLICSTHRNALAAAGKKGRYWLDLPATGVTSTVAKLARLKFLLDAKELFDASRVVSGDLQRLFELAFRPRSEALLQAAIEHEDAGKWGEAAELLVLAEETLDEDQRISSVAYLNLAQKVSLHCAHCAMHIDQELDALALLAGVSGQRAGDDLLRATKTMHETPGWLLTLALAHEEAGQSSSAANVYAKLMAAEPDQDLYVLSRARALRRAGESADARKAYVRFIDGRVREELTLDQAHEGEPELVAACLEAGELLEEMGEPAAAASRYLALIREAPLAPEGYGRLFRLRDALTESPLAITSAAEILRLLNPAAAAKIDDLPARHEPCPLPADYSPISDSAHDESIVHETERNSGTIAQKWIGALTGDERETRDIERHARRIDGAHYTEAFAVLDSIAELFGVAVPRLYLSYGSSGIEALAVDDPFVLLGACHLEAGDPRHLPTRQLAFALGGQVEHIRANHLLLTSSEFWRTFGTKSATALLAFVPMGELIGKVTDGSVLKWVGKLKGTTETRVVRSLLEIAENRVTEGAAAEGLQAAYTAALAKARTVGLTAETEEKHSLVKERLADFARSAQYTADRAGLLACDDVGSAVEAMFRLSPSLHDRAAVVSERGFLAFLEAEPDGAAHELTLRVAELLKFALSDDYRALRAATIRTTA